MNQALTRRTDPTGSSIVPSTATTQSSGEAAQLRDIGGLLRRHKRLIIGSIGSAVILAVLVTLLMTPVWQSIGALRIDEKPTNLRALDVLDKLAGTEVNTEVQVLKSRSLAEHIVDSLGLQLRMEKPRGVIRAEVFTQIQVSHPAGSSGPHRPKPMIRRVFDKVYGMVFDSSEFVADRTGPHKWVIRNNGTGREVATIVPGQVLRIGDVQAVFEPKDTTDDYYKFVVEDFADAVDDLQDAFDVVRVDPLADLVQLKYKDTDAQLVTQVPNAIMADYMANRQDVAHAESRSTVKFLKDQLDKLTARVALREDSLRKYEMSQQIVSLPDEARTSVERAATLRAQRADAEAERSALAQLVAALDKPGATPNGESPYRHLVAFPTLLKNQAATQLLSSLATEEDKRADLLSRRSMDDPDVQVLTARVQQLEGQLRSIATTYLKGLSEQVSAYDTELDKTNRQMASIPAKQIELTRLQREPRAMDTLYLMLQTRLKEAEIAAAVPDPSVRVIDEATTPSTPLRPKPFLNLALALLAGALLGVAGAFAREYVDKTVRSRRDALAVTGTPVLGLIPHIRRRNRFLSRLRGNAVGRRAFALQRAPRALGAEASSVAASTNGASTNGGSKTAIDEKVTPATEMLDPVNDPLEPIRLDANTLSVAEAFNRLAVNLAFANPEESVSTVVITSALPRDGKTTVAVNLAATLAQRGRRVLLVDADLRRGLIHAVFGSPRQPGLSEVIEGKAELNQAIRKVEVGEHAVLHFFPTGALPLNPAQLLGSPRVRDLLEFLKEQYDTILLEAPPLNVVSDAAMLASNADGVVVVARAGVTGLNALSFAVEQLQHVRARVIGTVLNDIDRGSDTNDDYSGLDVRYYARATD